MRKASWPLLLLLFAGARTLKRSGSFGDPLQAAQVLKALRSLATSHGFPDPATAAAVAMAESGGNRLALGDWGTSYGLWQIHTPAHPQYRGADLFDADNNARAAFAISKGGTDWSPWTTFRNGDYRRFLGRPE